MIEINRLLSVGDSVSVNINGLMRTGTVKATTPMVSVTVDFSTNLLAPKNEKFYFVAGVDNWLTETQYNALPKPPRP